MLPISRTKLTPVALLVSALLVSYACNETTVQPNAPLTARMAVTPPEGDYIATPAGWYHRSCVHEIPNGAHVDIRGLVTRRDGSTFQIPKCLYPNYPNVPHLGRQGAAVAPTDNNWIEDADYELGSGNSYHQLTAGWRVPAAPTGSYSGTQLYYSFPGLENINDPVVYIIQPVLQYGYNNDFGGSYWTGASWRCHAPNDCLHGTPITSVSATDSVYGSVTASACVNGTCTWTITIVDVTKGTRSDWTADDTENYDWSTGGAVEVYGLNTCDQYPVNGVFYSGISLYDKFGSQVSPAWSTYIQSGLNPACNFQVTPTATTVSLYEDRPPSASISGPTDITQAGTYTWTANPSGGIGTYTYAWQYRDAINPNWVGAGGLQSVSKSVSASTASWFDYEVIVTSGDQSGQASVHVINELGQCNPYCSPLP